MEKKYFFVIPEMPSKTYVMLYKKLPDHFKKSYLLVSLALESLLYSEGTALCLPLPPLKDGLWDRWKLLVWHSEMLKISKYGQTASLLGGLSSRHGSDDVRISGVGNGEGADAEVLSTRGSQLVVVTNVVMNTSLRPDLFVTKV